MYIYFVIAFLVCIAENVKLFLFMNHYDFDFEKVNLDWATFTIIAIIFISSIVVLVFMNIKIVFQFLLWIQMYLTQT